MTQEQNKRLEDLRARVTDLQNRCNRAQKFILEAEGSSTDETLEAFIKEAELSLER